MEDFVGFPKIARLSRKITITEKIDGTNAQVIITDDGVITAGSRSRYLTLEQDNFGFARWVEEHKKELLTLGPGRHFGEWWGCGIQRNYGLKEKRWSLFNTRRWCLSTETPALIPQNDPRVVKYQDVLPSCCSLVPVLYEGLFDTVMIDTILDALRANGSKAAPSFMNPEGIIIYHVAGNVMFKKTIENDFGRKGDVI